MEKSYHRSSFHFDEDDWDDFREHMHEWKDEMKDWKHEWKKEWHDNIDHHIEIDIPLEEIGEEFNLTRERVRQIKEKAIKRLKNITRCKILKSYLG